MFTIGFVSVFVYQYVILTKFVTLVIVLFSCVFILVLAFFRGKIRVWFSLCAHGLVVGFVCPVLCCSGFLLYLFSCIIFFIPT